ncbi:MAG: ATP-dependent DNA helicase RecG [Alphaproteobacteria bacterium]
MSQPVRPTMKTSPLSPYGDIAGLAKPQLTKLQELCGPRWIDLLLHLPSGIMDRSATPTIAEATVGEQVTLQVTVLKHIPKPYPKHRRPHMVKVVDAKGAECGEAELIFFSVAPWVQKSLPIGETVVISGKVEGTEAKRKIIHPTLWGTRREVEDVAKIWPLYPLTAGLSHLQVKRATDAALKQFPATAYPEWLPDDAVKHFSLMPFHAAIKASHNPQVEGDISPTSPHRLRLAWDELFAYQLALLTARRTTKQEPGIAHGVREVKRQQFYKNLPFALTGDQQQALDEIDRDLTSGTPMLRLVQGDVGSGKTVVALAALLRVLENGCQGAMMAPTEILARQHYEHAKKWLEPLGFTVALLVGSIPAAAKKRLKQHIGEGFANLVIGTHALVQEDVVFDRLGLIVIDEQHRFGVRERMRLTSHRSDGLTPDVLVMTATPIPRTLALTAYGDMDVSIIREKPPGRTPITTNALPLERVPEVANSLARVLAKNEQAYWVCPLVEENEELDLTAATERFATLQQLYGDAVALLHGKMKPAEKDATMADFKAGKTKILVATTVIEVGVDVPQATVMVIEHAERFGLSQLHQLRGRVGRGSLQSTCLLLYQAKAAQYAGTFANQRIQALRESEDGFYLAEKDMELRGPGEILGTQQAGFISTRVADLTKHRDLIPHCRRVAEKLMDTPLSLPQKRALTLLLRTFGRDKAAEMMKAG